MMNKRYTPVIKHQKGLTLVELMIALALGLTLSAGALMMFIGNKETATFQEQFARVQENGRFATDILMREIRPAGYWGCGGATNPRVTNTLEVGTGVDDYSFDRGVLGYQYTGSDWAYSEDANNNGVIDSGESTTATTAMKAANPLPGTDMIVIKTVGGGDCRVLTHNGANLTKTSGGSCGCTRISCKGPVAASMTFSGECEMEDDDVVMVSDCEDAALFQLTNVNTSSGITKVVHNTGTGTIGNCTKQLGKLYVGGSVLKAYSYIFMIKNNAQGNPSLYRYKNGVEEELIEGVQDMQFLFGEDTNGDGAVDDYKVATQVLDWDKVFSVRLDLIARSVTGTDVLQSDQTITIDRNNDGDVTDAGETVTDKNVKQVFSTTVVVRNRTT